jgi:hypothetical protein
MRGSVLSILWPAIPVRVMVFASSDAILILQVSRKRLKELQSSVEGSSKDQWKSETAAGPQLSI